MISDGTSYAIEMMYSDPSAAHERALKMKACGAFRCVIEPLNGRFILTGWFRSSDEALEGADKS